MREVAFRSEFYTALDEISFIKAVTTNYEIPFFLIILYSYITWVKI